MMALLNRTCKFLFYPAHLLLHWALPPICVVCEHKLDAQEGLGVCPPCWRDLPRWNKEQYMMPALPDGIDSFDAPMVYEDPVRGMVKKLKFDDKPELVQPLVSLMRSNVANVENPLVLPVPMHRSRLWKRQFNQSSLLAVRLAKVLQLEVDVFSFKRIKKTEQQVGKSASARKKNLSGAFQVDAAKVDGRNIILVDDVWTTGSTASACAKCLKRAGAKSVHVVTIAYVPK